MGPFFFSPCARPLEDLILTVASVTTQKQIALDLLICSKSEYPKDLLDNSIIDVERVLQLHISKAKLMASVLVLVLNLSKQNNYQFDLQSQKSWGHIGQNPILCHPCISCITKFSSVLYPKHHLHTAPYSHHFCC